MAVKGGSGGMEKRKENARYLNQCFTMMVLLNCIIVLFLAFTIDADPVQSSRGAGSTAVY